MALIVMPLVACGVRVEVAPTVGPTGSGPLLTATAPTVDLALTRIVAAPRVAFTDDGQAQVQLFMSPTLPDAYLIVNHTLQLSVQYDTAWFGDQPGSARLHLSAATRPDTAHPWLQGDNAEQPITSSTVPAGVADTLNVYVTPNRPGKFEVRAEVEIVVYPATGASLNRIDSKQLTVTAFSDPGAIPLDPERFRPSLGTLNANSLLFDWRSWVNPCTINTSGSPPAAITAVQTACKAANAHNIPALLDALNTLRSLLTQPPEIGQWADEIGLITASTGDWATAAKVFGAAADIWQTLDNVALMAISRQNQIAALAMTGDNRPDIFSQLLELHDQYSDDAGRFIIQANLARLSGQHDPLDEANNFFVNNGLPQADVTQEWLRQFDATATAAPPN